MKKLFRATWERAGTGPGYYSKPTRYVVADDLAEAYHAAKGKTPEHAGPLLGIEHISDEVIVQ